MRRLLMSTTLVVALVALAALALPRMLASTRLRAAVEARLSATLGQPVSIGRMSVHVLPSISVDGTTIRVGEARVEAPSVNIERVRIVPRLHSLWGGNIVIEQVALDGFVVSVVRDDHGWHVPSAVPAPSANAGAGVVIERVRVTNGQVRVFDAASGGALRPTASIDELEADVSVEAGGLRLAPIRGRIGRAKISGDARTDASAVHLRFAADAIADDDLPVFLRLLGSDRPGFLRLGEPAAASVIISVDRASSRLGGAGTLRAPQVLLDTLRLQHLEAPFAIKGAALEFNPTTFAMYGGTHRGRIAVDLSRRPPAWMTDSRVNNLDVGGFLRALTGREQPLDGTASIDGALRGVANEPLDRTVRGRARVTVAQGVVRNFPLLATINRALRLTQQQEGDTRFERLTATLTLAGGEATTDDLALDAGHVRVEAAGRIGADRSLALRGHAVIAADYVAQRVARVPEIARLKNRRGEIDVPLTISGSLGAPSIAVDVKTAVGQGIADELRRRLRRLIR